MRVAQRLGEYFTAHPVRFVLAMDLAGLLYLTLLGVLAS